MEKKVVVLDALGLKCPQPIMKIAIKGRELNEGDILEVIANCPTFPTDLKEWCAKREKTLLFCNEIQTGVYKAQIQF